MKPATNLNMRQLRTQKGGRTTFIAARNKKHNCANEDDASALDVAEIDVSGCKSDVRQRQISLESELIDILACTFSEMAAEQGDHVFGRSQLAA